MHVHRNFKHQILIQNLRYTVYVYQSSLIRGFVFSNYQSLNNGILLLELGEILKQKWHKTTKNLLHKEFRQLHIFQIKKSLTHDQIKHHGRGHS